MRYLLDTNTCIRYLNGRSPNVIARVRATTRSDITICAIVKAELFAGAEKSQQPAKNLAGQRLFLDQFISLPFDDAAAVIYVKIRATLEKAGTPIGPNDLLIAAIALANGLTLVTHNTREFSRIAGLSLEDWEL